MDFSSAAVCIDGTTTEILDRTLSHIHVVHTTSGRVRLQVPALQAVPDLTRPLEALLRLQPGVVESKANSWCQSVTITYDSTCWTADGICAFVQHLRYQQLEQFEIVATFRNECVPSWISSWIQPSICWIVAGCITLVLGIILFALPMIPGGTPLLFLSTVCFSRAAALKLEQVVAI